MKRVRQLQGAALAFSVVAGFAAEVDISKLPPPATATIEFDRDIKPIFEKACFRCHGPERPKSNFRLDQRDPALKGGAEGVSILPGKSAESKLIHFVARLVEDMEMPPAGKGDPLTATEIGLLRAWIDQGVAYGAATAAPKIQFAMTTGVRAVAVSGDKQKFREHQWMGEGWSGGLERLTLRDRTTNGVNVTAEARAMFDEGDYLMKLRLDKPDVGFVQFGFEQYRRYTDDSGLAFPGYPTALSSSGRDFEMESGRSWIDFGLTLPNWPKLTVGYEHQYREGDKSTLQYDFVSPDIATDPVGRALLPTSRRIDEDVHIVKFGFDHEIAGFRLQDDFRGEFYNLSSDRERSGVTVAGLRSGYNGAREHEEQDHFQGANSFTLEKQVRDWLFISAGYLYARLDGGAEFDRRIFVPVNPNAPTFLGEDSNGILLDQDTHAFSVATMFGPWDGLSFYGSLQNEWLRQDALGASTVQGSLLGPGDPSTYNSSLGRATFTESFGLKYTKIPLTVLHADARWQQENTDLYENYLLNDGLADDNDFLRDTDARARWQEYRAGFTVSPWRRASFSSDLKHRAKNTQYDHRLDTDLSATPGDGYPAFITERDITSNSIDAKATVKMASWLRTTFKYELVATDFHTTTDPVDDGAGTPIGGGELSAGNYDAHVWSVSAGIKASQRLLLSATFSYALSRIVSGANNSAQLVPYEGDIYSVISSATFALNQKTDLHGSYFFSKSDYSQNNSAAGLPVGLAYDRHGLLAGVTYHWKPNLSLKLNYGFFHYDEPSTQRLNNYEAHAVFASMTWTLN